MAGLRGEYLATLLTLGVVDRNSALATLDEDDERNHGNSHQANTNQREYVDGTQTGTFEGLSNGCRQTGNNAGENQHRDTVTDTSLGDLLTEPHHEHCASNKGSNSHKIEAEPCVKRNALTGQTNGHTDGLYKSQHQRQITRVLTDLPASGLPFLLQLLKRRGNRRHQLHDDGCRDVRHDAQSEDTHSLQGTAGEHVEQAKDRL